MNRNVIPEPQEVWIGCMWLCFHIRHFTGKHCETVEDSGRRYLMNVSWHPNIAWKILTLKNSFLSNSDRTGCPVFLLAKSGNSIWVSSWQWGHSTRTMVLLGHWSEWWPMPLLTLSLSRRVEPPCRIEITTDNPYQLPEVHTTGTEWGPWATAKGEWSWQGSLQCPLHDHHYKVSWQTCLFLSQGSTHVLRT